MKHFLSIESLSAQDLRHLLERAAFWKTHRRNPAPRPLADQTWAMMFTKSSTRTRVSFEVGVRELGGNVFFLSPKDIQLGRGEPIKDTARVLGRMVDGAIIRTFGQEEVEEFARYSSIPTINALTDAEHPCQIVADIQTFVEKQGPIEGRTVAFIGDAACNVAVSWIFAAARLGFQLRLGGPAEFLPSADLLERAGGDVICTEDPRAAVEGADLVYTDVWVSMGKEDESRDRLEKLAPYQVNQALVEAAGPEALVMHCLPAYREKEITEAVLEAHADTIFTEAENRLHAQKAVLEWLVS